MEADSSINQIIEMIKHLKTDSKMPTSKRQLSSIDFSERNGSADKFCNSLLAFKEVKTDEISMMNLSTNNHNVFHKLHQQKKQLEQRKVRLQYESRKSRQEQQSLQCTFSPRISYSKTPPRYRIRDKQSFYHKNIEWLQRKQKNIKVKQCQKNQENIINLTFTPHINKRMHKKKFENDENANYVTSKKGVNGFLDRQKKAKQVKQYVEQRKKNPYSHIWNVKKGYFSYVN